MDVLIPEDVDASNLHLKKTQTINHNLKIIPIKYKKHYNLIIQTPIMGIPFNINIYKGKYYLSLSFQNYDIDDEMKYFFDKINTINKKIKSYLSKKNKECDYSFDDSIKTNNEYPPIIRVNIPDYDKLLVFDEQKNQIGVTKVNKKTQCYSIIHLSHIWNHNMDYGISWKLLQLRMIENQVSLSTYSFIEKIVLKRGDEKDHEETDHSLNNSVEIKEEDKIKNHPDFKKYFTMLKFGVSKEAVRNRLLLDGLDTNIADIDPESATPSAFKDQESTNVSDGFNFEEVSLSEVSYIQKLKDNNKNVPTLQDILEGKANLTKTNYELKNVTFAPPQKNISSPGKKTSTIMPISKSMIPTGKELMAGMKSLKKPKENKHPKPINTINQPIVMPTANDLLLGIKKMKNKKNN